MRSTAKVFVHLLVGVDAVLLAATLALTWPSDPPGKLFDSFAHGLIVPTCMVFLGYFGVYDSHRIFGFTSFFRSVMSSQTLFFFVTAWLLWLAGHTDRLASLVWFTGLSTVGTAIPRLIFYGLVRPMRRRGYDVRRTCVIGSWDTACELFQRLAKHPEWGMQVTSVGIGHPASRQFVSFPDRQSLGTSLEEVQTKESVDEVVIAVSPAELSAEQVTIALCEMLGLNGRLLLKTPASSDGLDSLWNESSLPVGRRDRDVFSVVFKRVVDLVISITALILLVPVFSLIAVLIKLSSPGSVVFSQKRVGLNGRWFSMYKFRTMLDTASSMMPAISHRNTTQGPAFKDPQDPRVTPIGRLLRRYSLDELPQLINVVLNDMSLVGPRPLPVEQAAKVMGEHRRRFCMKPGLTCLWQVSGRSEVKFARWMGYDLEYVDTWSLWLDAKLLLRTIPAVVTGRGAY